MVSLIRGILKIVKLNSYKQRVEWWLHSAGSEEIGDFG